MHIKKIYNIVNLDKKFCKNFVTWIKNRIKILRFYYNMKKTQIKYNLKKIIKIFKKMFSNPIRKSLIKLFIEFIILMA